MATPAFHHWHHTNDGPHVLDKNYASTLPLLDQVFGTFYLPKASPEKYGTDTHVAASITGQMLDPLTKAPTSLTAARPVAPAS